MTKQILKKDLREPGIEPNTLGFWVRGPTHWALPPSEYSLLENLYASKNEV